ncbi:desampylase [Haloarchaeobius sp. HME9146]|uniref:desampylase n=1 Tax=Haloarchaeobius sp. HME9146 TaxID=2978732 RepID=UPI0021BF6C1A|nr:desampylase [Haloarchaeobius sp. HME9146]MCT9095400.1 M67 family metallopeptidase [Haloarchaeobius sp. HME9146]
MGNRHLLLPDDCRSHLLAHARAVAPDEACGVLGGTEDPDGDRTVTSVHPVTNVADSPRTRYELDPTETVHVIDKLEESGHDVVGFYHSHPAGPAGPSSTDRAQATWKGKVYCIVSLAGETTEKDAATIGAWVWTGDEFETLQTGDDRD